MFDNLQQQQSPLAMKEQQLISYGAKSILATLQAQKDDPSPPIPDDDKVSSTTHSYHHDQHEEGDDDSMLISTQLQQILSSLDDLDHSDNHTMLPSSNHNNPYIEDNDNMVPSNTVRQSVHTTEDLEAVSNDVTTTVITQRIELQNKSKTIEMLQKALSQQRELTVYHAKEIEKDSQKRLKLQKEEYETTIQRHQCLINQLIDDKQSLSDKCEALLKELCEVRKKFETKISALEQTLVSDIVTCTMYIVHNYMYTFVFLTWSYLIHVPAICTSHALETKKLKKTTLAAEKLKRQKWQAEEAQKIKEATIKHLEPELQRVIAKGKSEVEKLKAIHEVHTCKYSTCIIRK